MVILPLVLYACIKIPAIQTIITREVASKFSKELNTEISIGGVDIVWVSDIALKDVVIKDKQDRNFIKAQNIRLKVGDFNIPKVEFNLSRLMLHDAEVNLIKQQQDSVFNYKFLIEYFSSGEKDTVKKENNFKLDLDRLILNRVNFKYKNELKDTISQGMAYNNIQINDLNLDAFDLSIVNDTIKADIKSLMAKEHCGLDIKKMKGLFEVCPTGVNIQNLDIETPRSEIEMNLALEYDHYSAFLDFINDVTIKATVKPTKLNMADIGYFAPELKEMTNELSLSGVVDGTVAKIAGNNLIIGFGENSKFYGDVSIKGLPDIRSCYNQLHIYELQTNVEDVQNFKLPGNSQVEIPKQLIKANKIAIQGSFEGVYNDFYAGAFFKSDLGAIETDLKLKRNDITEIIEYDGKLIAHDFEFGEIIETQEYFGKLNLNAQVTGQGISKETIHLRIDGMIDSLDFQDNNYNSIIVRGDLYKQQFRGQLVIDDEFINLDFSGLADFTNSPARFDFITKINDARPGLLNISDRDLESNLSTRIYAKLTASDIDDLTGTIDLKNTSYYENSTNYYLEKFKVKIKQEEDSSKSILIESDMVDAYASGLINLSSVGSAIQSQIYKHMTKLGSVKEQEIKDQNFDFRVNLKNIEPITHLFIPQLKLARNTKLKGKINSISDSSSIELQSNKVYYSNVRFEDIHINSYLSNESGNLHLSCDSIIVKDIKEGDSLRVGLQGFNTFGSIKNDTANYAFSWDLIDHKQKGTGTFEGYVDLHEYPKSKIDITYSNIFINDSVWKIGMNQPFIIDSGNYFLDSLLIHGGGQELIANGIISHNIYDSLDLDFKNLDVSQLDLLLNIKGLDIDGLLNGEVTITDIYQHPNFIANLEVNKLYFNKVKLGDAFIRSRWNDTLQMLKLQSDIIYTGNVGSRDILHAKGKYYPLNAYNNIDLDIETNKVDISVLEPFFEGLVSNMKGKGSGKVHLGGSTSEPKLTGSIDLIRSGFTVDYLNTFYSFANEVVFTDKYIGLENMELFDTTGNMALCNGKIFHNSFKDFFIDITIEPHDFNALNTNITHNDMFYGEAYASGLVTIKGPLSDIVMDVDVQSKKGTEVFIPVTYATDVSDNDFITFVTKSDSIIEPELISFENETGFSMNLKVGVDQNANVEIILPYQMGKIKGNGEGDVMMNMDSEGEFSLFGDYNINSGSFQLVIQNMLRRNFNIQEGGLISWKGDPFDADINLQAIYQVRTNLGGLPGIAESADSPEYEGLADKRVDVQCVINLKNKLFNPTIDFSIDLPNADQETKDKVFRVFDTTNIAEVNKQIISLLALGSFVAPSVDNLASNSIDATSAQMLSNTLNNWLSTISNDFDIGINYRPGDNLSAEELDVALRTQLFDDRVTIDGNFGVKNSQTADGASNIVGDVNVEYKITQDGRFKVRAFNRTNDLDLINNEAPYTQGLGVFYKREFDSFRDLYWYKLFTRKNKKKGQDTIPGDIPADSAIIRQSTQDQNN